MIRSLLGAIALLVIACDTTVQVEDGSDALVGGVGAGTTTDVPDRLTCEQWCAERTARWGCTDYPCFDACTQEIHDGLIALDCLDTAEQFYACTIKVGHSCGDGCNIGTLGADYAECMQEIQDMKTTTSSAGGGP